MSERGGPALIMGLLTGHLGPHGIAEKTEAQMEGGREAPAHGDGAVKVGPMYLPIQGLQPQALDLARGDAKLIFAELLRTWINNFQSSALSMACP